MPSESAVTESPVGQAWNPKDGVAQCSQEPTLGVLVFPEHLQPFPGCGRWRAAFMADTKDPNPPDFFADLLNKDRAVLFTASTV